MPIMSSKRAGRGVVVESLEGRALFSTVPAGFAETVVTADLFQPTAMEVAPDGRLFVAQQSGKLRVVKDGALLPTPFATFDVNHDGERGFIGVTVDPDFETNHYVYCYITVTDPVLHNRIVRLTDDPATNTAVPGSQITIFDVDPLGTASNHNGGGMHFGPDGKLYVGTGENARPQLAQSLDSDLGKLLRINADGSIPTDNPFYGDTTGNNRAIWALGLRNPYTFGFEPGTGKLFINDVGQSSYEEVDVGAAGANYGWPDTEGATTDPRFTAPLYTYAHDPLPGGPASIVGGTFYTPTGHASDFPTAYHGDWLFADFSNGYVSALDPTTATATPFMTGLLTPVDIDEAADGSVYVLDHDGSLRQIAFSAGQAPTILAGPAAQTVAVGEAASFSASATGDGLTYQWTRDGVDIAGATSPDYALPVTLAADTGAAFRVRVTNAYGTTLSDPATLTVINAQRPVADIRTPKIGALYRDGTRLNFSGRATDPQDGKLKHAAFAWAIEYHHAGATDAAIPLAAGKRSGSFKIPRRTGTGVDEFYRLSLTVTDSAGLSTTATRDVLPRITTITVTSNVAGAGVSLNGQTMSTPFSFTAVAGSLQALEAVDSQTVDGQTYAARRWTNGHKPAFEFLVPASAKTLKARFKLLPSS